MYVNQIQLQSSLIIEIGNQVLYLLTNCLPIETKTRVPFFNHEKK